jgi:hypothetical protein
VVQNKPIHAYARTPDELVVVVCAAIPSLYLIDGEPEDRFGVVVLLHVEGSEL